MKKFYVVLCTRGGRLGFFNQLKYDTYRDAVSAAKGGARGGLVCYVLEALDCVTQINPPISVITLE